MSISEPETPPHGTPLVVLFTITVWTGGGPGRCQQCRQMRNDRTIIVPSDISRDEAEHEQARRLSLVAHQSHADQANADRWAAHWMHEQLAGRIPFAPLQRICQGCARERLDTLLTSSNSSKIAAVAQVGRVQPKLRTALFYASRAGYGEPYVFFVLNTTGSESPRDLLRQAVRSFSDRTAASD